MGEILLLKCERRRVEDSAASVSRGRLFIAAPVLSCPSPWDVDTYKYIRMQIRNGLIHASAVWWPENYVVHIFFKEIRCFGVVVDFFFFFFGSIP